jgi:serine/threonine protein kinase
LLDSHTAGPSADVYSLGCKLFHLLAGEPPFPSDSTQRSRTNATRTSSSLPPDLGVRRPICHRGWLRLWRQ